MNNDKKARLIADIAGYGYSPLAIDAAWYPSPIDLPEGDSGRLHVRYGYAEGSTPIISSRTALMRGVGMASAKLDKPLKYHKLIDDQHGLWMTDLPEELFQIAEMLAAVQPRGNVLVGGLGLGILARWLLDVKEVKRVTVIERDPDVIKLCQRPGYEVIQDDIKAYLMKTAKPFDCYLLDTWQMTSEACWWSTVMPLRRIIRQRFNRKPKIWCWAEDQMRGQVVKRLQHPGAHWYYEKLPLPMPKEDAELFFDEVGTKQWEAKYHDKLVAL